MEAHIEISELKTIEDLRQAEEAQRKIWAIHDDTEVVPYHLLLTAQKNGGLVLGSFDEHGEMIGFLFGFLARTNEGRWKHCSHMMGVLPTHRRAGVGEALKRHQRMHVLGQGLDLITWTVDPLEGVNASLNFAKLGVVCSTYQRDLYGEMADNLNRGLPTDRFEAEWWIMSERVQVRLREGRRWRDREELKQAGAEVVNHIETVDGLRLPAESNLDLRGPLLIVETPADFQAIKAASIESALAWRNHTRAIFEAYFAKGYFATDFISEQTESERRSCYVLQPTVSGLNH